MSKDKMTTDLLSKGKELHEMSCAACHTHPRSAFISYSVAKMIRPFALGLDRAGVRIVMWYIHILRPGAVLFFAALQPREFPYASHI